MLQHPDLYNEPARMHQTRRISTSQDQSPQRKCTISQICHDKSSEDGKEWSDADGGYSCSGDYSSDPLYYCTQYGSNIDQYGMTGNDACCDCGGGTCVELAPENPVARQSLLDLYLTTSGSNWLTNTHWVSEYHYCKWYGVTCSLLGEVTQIALGSNHLKGTNRS